MVKIRKSNILKVIQLFLVKKFIINNHSLILFYHKIKKSIKKILHKKLKGTGKYSHLYTIF